MPTSDESNSPSDGQTRPRRPSFTSSTFNALLGRTNTTASSGISPFPGPITTAAAQDQRRRMSTSGTSPTQTSAVFNRRFSVSTNNSDSIPESAIDDEEIPSNPTTPFARRMSKAAEDVLNGSNALRKNLGSPSGANGRAPPRSISSQAAKQASMTSRNRTASDTRRSGETFNWSEQIRSRAESSVSSAGGRPSFSNSSTGIEKSPPPAAIHERAKSVSQAVPKQDPPPPQTLKERIYSKPDEIGERMLKGDYYY